MFGAKSGSAGASTSTEPTAKGGNDNYLTSNCITTMRDAMGGDAA